MLEVPLYDSGVQYDLIAAVQRAPQVALLGPLNIIGDEQVQLSVAIVIHPRGAGAEAGVLDSGCRGHVFEFAVALVMKEMVASESGDVDVVASVVIIVRHGYADAIHFHIQAAAARNIGERAVMVVAIKGGSAAPAARHPVFSVHQQDVDPAVAVGIEKRSAGAECLRQIFLSGLSGVVDELDPGLSRYISKLNLFAGDGGCGRGAIPRAARIAAAPKL